MIVELISKECGDDPRTEKGRRIITTFLTCFIGNDVLTGVTSENIKMPMKYRNGAPFSLLSCGSLTPLLAFAGLTEEGQRTITQGQIEHKLLTVDKYKFVGDAINFWKTIAASCRSFEEFEEKCSNLIKIDIQKNIVGLVFNTEQLDLISTILTNRIATLKSIFSSEAYGFKAFCTLLGTLTHHKGLWNNKESVQTALHAAQIDPKSEYFVVYASNLVEVETIHRDNPDRSIDSFIAETVRKYGNSLDTLLRLNPDLVIVNSESQHRVLFRTVQSVLTYFSKEPELGDAPITYMHELYKNNGIGAIAGLVTLTSMKISPGDDQEKILDTLMDGFPPSDKDAYLKAIRAVHEAQRKNPASIHAAVAPADLVDEVDDAAIAHSAVEIPTCFIPSRLDIGGKRRIDTRPKNKETPTENDQHKELTDFEKALKRKGMRIFSP